MAKKPYIVKVKAKRTFENVHTGRQFKKGKTYNIRFSSDSAKHIMGNKRETTHYKVISVRKKPVR